MGPRMVNLSECMDPKRYSLEAVPAGAHARFCQAKRIARLRQGWGRRISVCSFALGHLLI